MSARGRGRSSTHSSPSSSAASSSKPSDHQHFISREFYGRPGSSERAARTVFFWRITHGRPARRPVPSRGWADGAGPPIRKCALQAVARLRCTAHPPFSGCSLARSKSGCQMAANTAVFPVIFSIKAISYWLCPLHERKIGNHTVQRKRWGSASFFFKY